MLSAREAIALFKLSQACHSRDLATIEAEVLRYADSVNVGARVFGDYYLTDPRDPAAMEMMQSSSSSSAQGQKQKHSLFTLSLQFCDEEVVRLLLEQGFDVAPEDAYATAALNVWREDGLEKALVLEQAAHVSVYDKAGRFANPGLCFLSADRLLPLLRFLLLHNFPVFEKLFCQCRAVGVDYVRGDADSEALREFMREYEWVASLSSDDY